MTHPAIAIRPSAAMLARSACALDWDTRIGSDQFNLPPRVARCTNTPMYGPASVAHLPFGGGQSLDHAVSSRPSACANVFPGLHVDGGPTLRVPPHVIAAFAGCASARPASTSAITQIAEVRLWRVVAIAWMLLRGPAPSPPQRRRFHGAPADRTIERTDRRTRTRPEPEPNSL